MKQIQGVQTNLLQAQSDLTVQIASELQPDTYLFKKKGNEQQFSFNRKVAKTSVVALKALESGDIPKAKEELNKSISLINTRQKIIKLADKSEFGWATVQEYVSASGKLRLILDLSHLNKFVVKKFAKYEDLRTVLQLFSSGSFDVKSAYHHIDTCEEHTKFLSFKWPSVDGTMKFYEFKVPMK